VSVRPAAVVVLAAGEGTRMKSAVPKVLHELGGRTLVGHAVAAAQALEPAHLAVVVGHGRDQVEAHLARIAPGVTVAIQDRQLGTGHAVSCALEKLPELDGVVVVTYGDVPLLTGGTLRDLVDRHVADGNGVTVLTAELENPAGYGRVVRDASGGILGIVEQQDASTAVQQVREINSGIYAFDARVLSDGLARLTTDNAQGELYLTDLVAIARTDGRGVGAHRTADGWQTEGVNDRTQLAALGGELNRRILDGWMRAGVSVVDPATTWVDVTVELGRDVVLRPGVQLHGATRIDDGAQVGPDSTLTDCSVGAGAIVIRTHAFDADIGADCAVGPFTYLRPGTRLARGAKAGAHVEIKASSVGEGSKVPHLSYVGDAEIGDGVNIGAAAIVVNYDGVEKHRTVIGDHAFIGCDTMLVAPVTVGDGAHTAAGSVVTDDVPPGAMAVGRARQRNVEGWVERKRAGSAAAGAAARARAGQTGGEDRDTAGGGEGSQP
jgi:bifunctional UDP-N-acetylglucosamine pyrophosphorylase/glucosamine-1-phosphate N-acetyltransferase